jgi:outer membrane protein assembly factor BamE (lipoprotein component of BamABCDE complex)
MKKTMKIFQQLLLYLIVVCIFSGCVSLGRNFTRIAPDSIIIGKSTKEEIIQKLGRPKKDKIEIYNDESVNTIEYYYITTSKKESPFFEGIIPLRKHIFYFWNDKLVGQLFCSNFLKDNTYFEEDKALKVRKGLKKEDVLQIMGLPSGENIYPLIEQAAGEQYVYFYHHSEDTDYNKRNVKVRMLTQRLDVYFNDQGIVADIEYSTSGE